MTNATEVIDRVLALENVLSSVEALPGHHLRLSYTDGESYVIDFRPILRKGGVTDALWDEQVFAAVGLGRRGRSIEFPGEIDFCADALRLMAEQQASARCG